MRALKVKKTMKVIVILLSLTLVYSLAVNYYNIPPATTVKYSIVDKEYSLSDKLNKLYLDRQDMINKKAQLNFSDEVKIEKLKYLDEKLYEIELNITQLIKLLKTSGELK